MSDITAIGEIWREVKALRDRVATLEKENAGLRGLADLLPRANDLLFDAVAKWQDAKKRADAAEAEVNRLLAVIDKTGGLT